MKKLLSIIAMALIFAIICTGVAEDDELMQKLGNDYLRYLQTEEIMNTAVLWALSYVEQFNDNRTWKNLQIAKWAVYRALVYINGCKLPEPEMTHTDYLTLLDRDIDASFLLMSQENSANSKISLINSMLNTMAELEYDVYLQNDWNNAMVNTMILKRSEEYSLRIQACQFDWLMTEINDVKVKEAFAKALMEKCPETSKNRLVGELSGDEIKLKTHELLMEESEELQKLSAVVGYDQASLYDLTDAAGNGFSQYDIGALTEIKDLPTLLPGPEWTVVETQYFTWDAENQKVIVPALGDTITSAPENCIIQYSDVSREEMLKYINQLVQAGLLPSGKQQKDQKLTFSFKNDKGSLLISCEDNTAICSIENNAYCLVPQLYYYAMKGEP